MSISDLITPKHLERLAMIYIRQSSPQQVLSNQESLRLQYALQQRAKELGWSADRIEVIDTDLGMTAAAAGHRQGFKELLAKVTLGEVGIILSIDVTHLSRNCSDWYPLLDICGFKQCLIGDRDGIYDPGTANGRLLLVLKGQISELELHTIRSRLMAGLLNKVDRGELALPLPVGLTRDERGVVLKDPNMEVRQRLELVFSTFLQVRSASKTAKALNDQELSIPRRDRFGEVTWKRPTISAVLLVLRNPAYAGAFVYGRRQSVKKDLAHRPLQRPLPISDWKKRINDKYPAYVSWETYEKIQRMLDDNRAEYTRDRTRGIPREGAALLQGLVYCGESGHKMGVQYKQGTHYRCADLRLRYGAPVCQHIPADPVDKQVVRAFFEALSCAELDLYDQALQEQNASHEKMRRAQMQQAALIQVFLRGIGSRLADEALKMDFVQLCRQMNLVDGPNEHLFPRNVGLMFFNEHPEKFFPYTQINVVHFPEGPAADKFSEQTFRGPLNRMIEDALRYVRSTTISEFVIKRPARAKADRFFNYPFEAVEEALVNAVYHRSYEECEPIEVRVLPDQITITSYPGADRSISLGDLAAGRVG